MTKKYEREEGTVFEEEHDFQLRIGLAEWLLAKSMPQIHNRFVSANYKVVGKKLDGLLGFSFEIIWNPNKTELERLKSGHPIFRHVGIGNTNGIALVIDTNHDKPEWYACMKIGRERYCCLIDECTYLRECLKDVGDGLQPGVWDLGEKKYKDGDNTLDEETDKNLRFQIASHLLPQERTSLMVLEGNAGVGKLLLPIILLSG